MEREQDSNDAKMETMNSNSDRGNQKMDGNASSPLPTKAPTGNEAHHQLLAFKEKVRPVKNYARCYNINQVIFCNSELKDKS